MTGAWPAFNAGLNATSAVLLILGFVSVRHQRLTLHKAFMVSALAVSGLFFISYIAYHAQVGSVRFQRQGWIRPVYFSILLTHTVLAVTIVPLALRTAFLAAKKRFEAHKAIARWTLPLWLYVCVSGVVVYGMLYHLQ